MELGSSCSGALVVSAGSLLSGWVAGGSVVVANVELFWVVSNVLGVDDDCGAGANAVGSTPSIFVGLVPTSAEAYSRLKRCGSWKSS